MKFFELAPFELRVTAGTIADALGRDYGHDLDMEEDGIAGWPSP